MTHFVVDPMRIVVFGSYYQGKAVIEKIVDLQKKNPQNLKLVGIATDDPLSSRVSPQKRIWQFAHPNEYGIIQEVASQHDISFWNDSVKIDEFYQLYTKKWKPDICYMATFGQLIPERIFDLPRLGFYNFHPSVDRKWPAYIGGNPFQGMMSANEPYCSIAMHEVDEQFDHGPLVAFSQRVPIQSEDTILSMYKKTCPTTANMIHWHLGELKAVQPYPQGVQSTQDTARPMLLNIAKAQ